MDCRNKLAEIKGQQTGVIDCHTHAGISVYNYARTIYPSVQSIEDLVRKALYNNVNWLICTSMSMYLPFEAVESKKQFPYELSNNYLMMETALFGANVLPFAAYHPTENVRKQCDLLESLHAKFGLYGLKLFTLETNCGVTEINPLLLELASKNNWPILTHSGRDLASHPLNVIRFAEKYPEVRVCVAHCGRFLKKFWCEVIQHPNIYVDVSPFLLLCKDASEKDEIGLLPLDYNSPEKVIIELNNLIPKRLLWGTDEPWTKVTRTWKDREARGTNYEREKMFLDSLTVSIRKDIAWLNTRAYLGI
ncbi:MAG: amidohydrolase family protein [bacterium]